MAKIEVYSSGQCPYCIMAKQFLETRGLAYTEIRVDLDLAKRDEMIKKSRQRTVPQIVINDQAIGGYTDLIALQQAKKLDSLLNQS